MSYLREKEIQTLLQQALKFTGDDLDANRFDILSNGQKAALKTERWSSIATVVLIGVLLGTFIFRPTNTIFAIVVMVLIALPCLWIYFKIETAIEQGQTDAVTGIVRRSIDFRYSRRRRRAKYQILVGNKTFVVPKHVHDAFVESEVYTIYYIPSLQRIVSGEMKISSRSIDERKSKQRPGL